MFQARAFSVGYDFGIILTRFWFGAPMVIAGSGKAAANVSVFVVAFPKIYKTMGAQGICELSC
jgi:hypothetical protein